MTIGLSCPERFKLNLSHMGRLPLDLVPAVVLGTAAKLDLYFSMLGSLRPRGENLK